MEITKSSADSMGLTMRSTVKKAAKLAVYELIRINVKNHHADATLYYDKKFKSIFRNRIHLDLEHTMRALAERGAKSTPVK